MLAGYGDYTSNGVKKNMEKNKLNQDYINNQYQLAGQYLQNKVTDWSNFQQWKQAVNELNKEQKAVYLIEVLNQQIINGGFVQYFDNSYGIFGYETLKFLKNIKATHTATLLDQALKIVNKEQLNEEQFSQHIANNIISSDLGNQLDQLDNQYYELEEIENLEELLVNWINTLPSSV